MVLIGPRRLSWYTPRRYILNMTISDQTGKAWVTAFNDIALTLLNNRSADELNEAKDNDVSVLRFVKRFRNRRLFKNIFE